MCQRLLLCLLTLAAAPAAAAAQDSPVRAGEKAPSVIPAPRAEPVVPPSPAKSIATQLNDAFVTVFDHVAPAVVIIDVYKRTASEEEAPDEFQEFFFRGAPGDGGGSGDRDGSGGKGGNGGKGGSGGKGGGSGSGSGSGGGGRYPSEGSGFIIQASGYILTNYHVVEDATTINVRLKDGRQFVGKVVGADEKTDIAVVKIDAADLPTAELADSDAVRVGQLACAIGVPYNLDYTFTTGVVSAKGRRPLQDQHLEGYEDYLQTDASINPGNSGGPLVDLDGRVIGMNSLIHGFNRGLGFAIPSNLLRDIGDQLIHAGRVVRTYIGVSIVSVENAQTHYGSVFSGVKRGAIVDTILADSPAFNSDLRQADVILDVDGAPVNNDRDLQKVILGKKVGATVQLTILRKSKTLKVAVVTGELPAPPTRLGATDGAGGEGAGETPKEDRRQFYGLQMQDLTRDLAASVGVGASKGVLVTAVADNSPASRAGIGVKDVITTVDDKPVKDVAALKEALKAGDPKKGILCYLDRLTGKTFAVIKTE